MSLHRSGPIRNEAARLAILRATAQIISQSGYDRLTIEGIAALSGTGKQTIYRWWRSKSEIVADSLFEGLLFREKLIVENSGDIRADLRHWLSSVFQLLSHSGGEGLLRSLIAAAAENAEIGRRLHEALGADDFLIERLRAEQKIGNLSLAAPLKAIVEALVGAVIIRALSREPIDSDSAENLIQVVLH